MAEDLVAKAGELAKKGETFIVENNWNEARAVAEEIDLLDSRAREEYGSGDSRTKKIGEIGFNYGAFYYKRSTAMHS